MILVDTSAWIDFFRNKGPVAAVVDDLLGADEVALCGPIVTELRRGLRSGERKKIMAMLDGCHILPDPLHLWEEAGDLGCALGRKGATVKTLDLLIATYALSASVPILTTDKDFQMIRRVATHLLLEPTSLPGAGLV